MAFQGCSPVNLTPNGELQTASLSFATALRHRCNWAIYPASQGRPRSGTSRLYAAGNSVGVSCAPRNAQRCSDVPTSKEGQGLESTGDTEDLLHPLVFHSSLVYPTPPIRIWHTLPMSAVVWTPMSSCRETVSNYQGSSLHLQRSSAARYSSGECDLTRKRKQRKTPGSL